jgi:hypothetical protein
MSLGVNIPATLATTSKAFPVLPLFLSEAKTRPFEKSGACSRYVTLQQIHAGINFAGNREHYHDGKGQ